MNTSKLRDTGLCAGNSPVTGEFPAQMTSNAEIVSIWWRHQDILTYPLYALDIWIKVQPINAVDVLTFCQFNEQAL